MTFRSFLAFLVFLPALLIITSSVLRGQGMTDVQGDSFSKSIRHIKVWTYAVGDSGFRYSQDALDELLNILSKKGYRAEQVFFKPDETRSVVDWKADMVRKLRPGEAFLELETLILMDTTRPPDHDERTIGHILNTTGVSIVNMNAKMDGTVNATYTSFAGVQVYAELDTDTASGHALIYSRADSVKSGDLTGIIRSAMKGVPKSVYGPLDYPNPTSSRFKSKVEPGLFFGYISGGTMSVTGGNVYYPRSMQYGLDISVRLSNLIDLCVIYNRIDTRIDVNSTKMPDSTVLSVAENYYLLGANLNFRINKVFTLYAGAQIGGVNTVIHEDRYRDTWYFAVQGKGGVKFYVSRFLGFNLQGHVLWQLHPVGAPYLYKPEPLFYPVDANSNLFQFGFSGGIFFIIG